MAYYSRRLFCFLLCNMVALAFIASSHANLSPTFYDKVCPQALPTIKKTVEAAVKKESRMGASLLRLHFHDCFVHGCDASILLDNATGIQTEKTTPPNNNSVRGYGVVDQIKAAVDKVCGGPVVSCADILAVAARDSVVALGGPTWQVQLGRRDSSSAYANETTDLPGPASNLSALITNFNKHGLNVRDLVALSGGHTIGLARCTTFRSHIYNDINIHPSFARNRQAICPQSGGDNNLAPLDHTASLFDTVYFKNLLKRKGLLHSDQELFNGAAGSTTNSLVKTYSSNFGAFASDFANSMIKMGNIRPLTGKQGQVRVNCRKVNS
ncbi:PREDICTED: cationic peroxidase 1-like [Nelumbo nucifera]|uniref:Peroxidase n=1 Tax=Nelumbo nucifera TaxID=4432 RepID=A0A1U7ZTR2_NELNU|nr:PREDICTED: cationic peroxidase 1-like [Nelumbo nucifera]